MKKKIITATNAYQKRYRYALTEPAGKNFAPDFKPELSPKEMLSLGIFCGKYFESAARKEFPAAWFKRAKLGKTGERNCALNYFCVDASQSREVWLEKGWIHPDDPYGWFQWYCRYWLGRRHEDDERQIKRWKQMTRHIAQIKKQCKKGDHTCRPRQRQALVHWAYDARKI